MSVARTVLGDVDPADLGVCDAHDHLFLRTPRLPGAELDDPAAAASTLGAFAAAGGGSLIQWTPYGLGRHAAGLAGLSRATGVHVVAATGLHQAVHYAPEVLAAVLPRLEDLFVAEVTDSIVGTGVRAGLIKVAASPAGLDAHSRRVFAAAATAHHATGAPIGVHLEPGTPVTDVLAALCGRGRVDPRHVVLGHLERYADPAAVRAALDAGTFLALDGPSARHPEASARLPRVLAAVIDGDGGDRLLLGADTTATGTGPGAAHLLTTLRPMLHARFGAECADAVFVTNPRRAYVLNRPAREGASHGSAEAGR
ncbi:hypothetical protein [Actinoplanes sp. URMC 104]|uniref:phosphotriesterase family protein n=1 Tax=Actinoplanes sp. URMC 104 TaxID=3423409 RepID=UPI003F1BAAC4